MDKGVRLTSLLLEKPEQDIAEWAAAPYSAAWKPAPYGMVKSKAWCNDMPTASKPSDLYCELVSPGGCFL